MIASGRSNGQYLVVGTIDRLDGFQRRHRWLGLPIAVLYKAFDDRAAYLAALLTYYGFVSLFPLLLILFSALGFFLDGHPQFRDQIERSALAQFPVIGPALRGNVTGMHGSGPALVFGVVGVLYGGTGVMQAAQASFNKIYAVPRNVQPDPIRSRLRSLVLLAVLGGGVIVAAGLTTLASTANPVSAHLDAWLRIVVYAAGFLTGAALFTLAFQLLTACPLRRRELAGGGLLAAVGWQVLQLLGGPYVAHRLATSSHVYGAFALVLVAIGWIYLQALVLVVAAEVNVVLARRLWPRALLTPFTDNVSLTEADERAYAMYAEAQRFKGFEVVVARFDRRPVPQPATATDPADLPPAQGPPRPHSARRAGVRENTMNPRGPVPGRR
jgi:YihY family inner membrane protein